MKLPSTLFVDPRLPAGVVEVIPQKNLDVLQMRLNWLEQDFFGPKEHEAYLRAILCHRYHSQRKLNLIVMMTGIPGIGKTALANVCNSWLGEHGVLLLTRNNFIHWDRRKTFDLVDKLNVPIITVSPEELVRGDTSKDFLVNIAKNSVCTRCNHPTTGDLSQKKLEEIVDFFAKKYTPPSAEECLHTYTIPFLNPAGERLALNVIAEALQSVITEALGSVV